MMTQRFKPIRVTPHFYQLGTPFFPVYLSVGEEAMLIEGGIGATFEMIVEQLKTLGIDSDQVKYLLLTHTHADHIGALPRLKIIWPHLKTIAGPLAAKILGNDGMIKQFQWLDKKISQIMQSKGEIAEVPRPLDDYRFDVDIVADEYAQYDLGNGISWTIHHIPGHSACQVALFEEKEATLAIGDATGFFNPEEDVMWPNYFESLSQYCSSIKKLARLPAKRVALSHNGVIEGGVKEFLKRALKETRAYHEEMLQRVNSGEDIKVIALEKAEWVRSIADHMPFAVMEPLCLALIKHSQKENESSELSFDL